MSRIVSIAASLFLLATVGANPPDPALPEPRFGPEFSDEQVRAEIEAQLPILRSSQASPTEQAIALRKWLHAALPVPDPGLSAGDFGLSHNDDALGKLLWSAESRRGGHQCGGASEIARRVYALFGFEAITLNVGFPEYGQTHVTTLVQLEGSTGEVWSIQDAYFNFTIRTESGHLMGFVEMLQHLVHDEESQIVVDDPPLPKTVKFYRNPILVPRIDRRYQLQAECHRQWDNFDEHLVSWQFRLTRTSMFDMERQLDARIGRSNPLYLFFFPINANGWPHADMILDTITSAREELLAATGVSPEDLLKAVNLPPQELDPIL